MRQMVKQIDTWIHKQIERYVEKLKDSNIDKYIAIKIHKLD